MTYEFQYPIRKPAGPVYPTTLPSGETTKFIMQDITLREKILNRIGTLTFNTFVTNVPLHWVRRNWLRLFGAGFGEGSSILRGSQVIDARYLNIGKNCSIGFRVLLDARGGITMGDNVVLASDVQILGGGHDINHPDFLSIPHITVIEDYAWIGSRAMILPCRIGRGAVVGAQSVVIKDVAPLDVVGGNPAKPFAKRDANALQYTPKARPLFY